MGRAISQAIKSGARILCVLALLLCALVVASNSMSLGLYGEALNVTNNSATTYVDCGEIAAASFTANHKYLIVVNVLFEGTSATNDINFRFCHGPDGSEVDFTDGTWRRDSQGGNSGNCFGGIAVFTQPETTEQVKLMTKAVATPNTVTVNLGQIFALDITDLTENTDYFFNEHTTDDSTMTTTFEDGASITVVGNSSDTWWVVGDVVRNTGSSTVSDHTRLNLDGNVDHRYINEGDDTSDKNSWLFSRSYVPDSSSIAKMQYGVESGTTGTYFSSRIFAVNLTKFRQFFAEDTTADSGSIQTNFVTLATESVTPEVTGDWFYIGGFTAVVAAITDSLNIRLQDDNDGSMGSDPNYGDDEPGVHAGDDTDEDGMTIFKMKSLTSGASRTVNLDARDTVSASSAKNRTLVGFALELEGGGPETLNFTATITPAGALTRSVTRNRSYAGTITPSGSLARAVTRIRNYAATITPSGLLAKTKLITRAFTATITPSGALTTIKAVVRNFTATITPSGSFTRAASLFRNYAATVTPSGSLTRAASFVRHFTATISPSGLFARVATRLRSYAGTIAPSGAFTSFKVIVRAFTATITSTGAFTRAKISVRSFVASVSPTGTFTKTISFARSFTATIAPAGALFKTIFKKFTATITAIGTAVVDIFGVADRVSVTVSDGVKTRAVANDRLKTAVTVSDELGN